MGAVSAQKQYNALYKGERREYSPEVPIYTHIFSKIFLAHRRLSTKIGVGTLFLPLK
jgi:hypothetical protein